MFTNHKGYIFHDSCGFESGGTSELGKIQEFVHEKATKNRLNDRLHAIWYALLMLAQLQLRDVLAQVLHSDG